MANGTEHFTASQQAGLSLSGVDMAYGLASSEASFQKGRIAQKEQSELESTILRLEQLAKEAEQSAKKKQRRTGIGRLVGAVIGTAIGATTGNPALARAAMTAAGGAIGGKIAQKGDVKSGLPSQFVPGGIFYANSREELEMKAQDFREAISEINEGMDRQLSVNFIFDMITGASFAKAGQYVPEGANLSLDEMYQIGEISFKDYIKYSAKQLLPGGLSTEDNAQLSGANMPAFDVNNPETWVTDYENPGQFKNAPKDFDITSYQNEKMIQSMQDFSREEMFNSYGKLHDPVTAAPIDNFEDFYKENPWGGMERVSPTIATKEINPLKRDLARVYKGNIGGDKFQTVIDEYEAAIANDLLPKGETIEGYYEDYFGKANFSQKYRKDRYWAEDSKQWIYSDDARANFQQNFQEDVLNKYGADMESILSPYNQAMESVLPGETMPAREATTIQGLDVDALKDISKSENQINTLYGRDIEVNQFDKTGSKTTNTLLDRSSYGVSNNPFVNTPTRSPEERGIITNPYNLTKEELWAKRAKDYNVNPVYFDPEFSIEAGRLLVEDLGYEIAYADSTLEKAFSAFRKDNPGFKGPIKTVKDVPYDVMQPYIQRFESENLGPNFVNPGGDAGLMQISPDWYNKDGKWKTNKDGTPSVTYKKLKRLEQLFSNRNQGLYNLQPRFTSNPLFILPRSL